jgi:hypothetical protein
MHCLVLAAGCPGPRHASIDTEVCRWGAVAAPMPPPHDLRAARPYRNYVAVTAVGPFAHHFALRYHDEEDAEVVLFAARRDAQGRIVVDTEGGDAGGIVVPGDTSLTATAAELEPFQRAVESELRSRCKGLANPAITYRGSYRRVEVHQFVAHYLHTSPTLDGWFGRHELHVDESLTHVLGEGNATSGWGSIEVPGPAHWVALTAAENGLQGIVAIGGDVAERVLAVARAYDPNAPVPTLAAVPVVAPAALLPPGYRARVVLTVTLRGQHPNVATTTQVARIELDVHDAVFGRAAGNADVTLGSVHYNVHATLVPEQPRKAASAREEVPYRGTLHLQIENDRGHTFERDYIASGKVDAEGDSVVAPAGFDLPGASSPSRENDLLHHTFTSDGDHSSVDVEVKVSLFDDPRHIL